MCCLTVISFLTSHYQGHQKLKASAILSLNSFFISDRGCFFLYLCLSIVKQITRLNCFCSKRAFEDDVYNFGFILLESLVGPIACEKGETFFLNEKVREMISKTSVSVNM